MNAKILITSFIVFFCGVTAHAGSPAALTATVVYDAEAGVSKLPETIVTHLSEVARDQAGIWADTILEGDYYADGQTRLDRVVAFTKGGEVVSYRITYSERAWDTSACEFDAGELETLSACVLGRISESTFVSHDLTSYERDLDDLANFN